MASARSLGHLTGAPDAAKEPLPSPQCGLAALCEMAKELPSADDDDDQRDESAQPLVAEGGRTSHLDLFSRVTENEAQWAAVVPLMGGEYVIPPHAAFLLSDFTRIRPLVRCECTPPPTGEEIEEMSHSFSDFCDFSSRISKKDRGIN